MKYRYTKDEFVVAVKSSTSIRQALLKLGIVAVGGNYQTFRNRVNEWQIDITHFTGQAHTKGKSMGVRFPIEDYFSNRRIATSVSFKKRLVKEGYFQWYCSKCKLTEWLDNPIPLELSHIDGNRRNNSLDNLELLCCNCHSFTFDWRKAKTKYLSLHSCKGCMGEINSNRVYCEECFESRKYSFVGKFQVTESRCLDCNVVIAKKSVRCTVCYHRVNAKYKLGLSTKISWPPLEWVVNLVKENGFSKTGRLLGVTDNAVRKHLLRRGCPLSDLHRNCLSATDS